MEPFRILYLDMNSFFASVEQQESPSLRGRPLAITAVEGGHGICVAASIEAKAQGVRTGTPVAEARRMAPGIVFRPSRHRLYVRYNLRLAEIFDQMAELERIRSVDEFQLRLSGPATTVEGARALVERMRARVRAEIGPAIRFSAGIGPNHLLAKIAGKLEKPDGFQWLHRDNMPGRLAQLRLEDLPGISRGISRKLARAGIFTIEALYDLDPRHARMIWRSVEGERFVRALQGENIPLLPTRRHGYGNSKVLAPQYRVPREAWLVGRWLLGKAAARMRRDGRLARRLSLMVRTVSGGRWSGAIRTMATADTPFLLRLYRQLWQRMAREIGPCRILSLGVHLGEVIDLVGRPGDLFLPVPPGEASRRERLSSVADAINRRFGPGTISFGIERPHPGFFERG